MSIVDEDYEVSICANCGKGEEESHKLKSCTACKLVKYCNRECQIAHRPQHKKECRKRAAELHDEELFKQPPPEFEDCPICFQLLPTLDTGSRYKTCCGKTICSGCIHAPVFDNQGNIVDNHKCPFCRTQWPTEKEATEWEKKRMDADDAIAIRNLGCYYEDGLNGFTQDYAKALELYHRAAELGNAKAYTNIGYAYDHGIGVEVDRKKAHHYYELSAMRGNAHARHKLGLDEWLEGNKDRALKHQIAVRGGCNDAMELIKDLYSNRHATKDDYTKALQSYQAYLGEIKSPQRDKAAAFNDEYRYY